MIRILIADDHGLLRKGLRDLLEAHPGWLVCGEAVDGRQLVLRAEELKPDVAVVDLLMPELYGIEATRRIREVSPGTAVLVLSGSYSEQVEEECVSAGARGFLLKTHPEERVILAIEALVAGETFFIRDASRQGGKRGAQGGARLPAQASALTSREIEITQLLAEGKTNWSIATILGISVRTVETHRSNVMEKLGLQSLVELVHYAVRNQMIQPLPSPGWPVTPQDRPGEGGR
jgi:DNA-binding NarL/FixJ family response regulator